jgi:hypothetical protein
MRSSKPDTQQARLLAAVVKSHQHYLAASSALLHPVHIVFNGSEAHRRLIEAERAASEQYETDRLALRAWRNQKRQA